MSSPLTDLRYTLRQLRRSPSFALTAVITLALGIGATTAMYSIVRSTLLAPLPYPRADELVGLGFSHPGEAANDEQTGETGDLLLAHATAFTSMGIADDGPLGANFSNGGSGARSIRALRVSSGYLPTVGVQPLLGHTFTAAQDLPGAAPAVVLSEGLWRSTLNADPHILGRVIHINADPYTVIGVMPATFATVDSPDLWEPLQLSPANPGYQGTNFQMIARLKPGVSVQQAESELQSLTQAIYRQFPDYKTWVGPGVAAAQEFAWPLQQVIVSNAHSSLIALSAAVLAVLLMGCLNLAGLITARAIARRSEIAVRTALGAGRATVLRLLLTESFVLALAGSFLGLTLARLAVPLLLRSSPINLPQLHQASINLPVAIFAILVGCATALLFGLLPALSAFRLSLNSSIAATRTAGASAQQQRLGKGLIVAQVCIATALLSAGALFLIAFLHMRSNPPGLRPQHLYALQVNLKGDTYASGTRSKQFVSSVEARLRQIPGVSQVSAVVGLPLDRGLNNGGGPAGHPELIRNIESRFVMPGYFQTVGTSLLAGEDISDTDTATSQPVALINEFAARLWFPGRLPVGEFVVSGGGKPLRVIGVVSNVRNQNLADAIRPTIYLPYSQIDDETMKTVNGWFPTTFVLRIAERGDARDPTITTAATVAVTAVDAQVPASKFAPMQRFLDESVAAPRFFSWLAGGFAIFALLLTLIGLFGLLSYQVASRTRELGIRMALGAQRRQVLTLILNSGLTLTVIGLALGIACSFALRGPIASLLSDTIGTGTTATLALLGGQVGSIAIAAVAMVLSAAAACVVPAQRAASINPTEALRAE